LHNLPATNARGLKKGFKDADLCLAFFKEAQRSI